MRKKMKFLVKEWGKFKEYSYLHFYVIIQKVDKKGCTKFSKKISIFLEHNFWPFIQFLLNFYALMFFRHQILPFFSFQKLKSSHTISFFILFNSLFSLSVFLVRNSLSWNSLIPHSSWGIAMRIGRPAVYVLCSRNSKLCRRLLNTWCVCVCEIKLIVIDSTYLPPHHLVIHRWTTQRFVEGPRGRKMAPL